MSGFRVLWLHLHHGFLPESSADLRFLPPSLSFSLSTISLCILSVLHPFISMASHHFSFPFFLLFLSCPPSLHLSLSSLLLSFILPIFSPPPLFSSSSPLSLLLP